MVNLPKQVGGTKKKRHKSHWTNKVVDFCVDCGVRLPKFNKHHVRCHECWVKYKRSKGNLLY